MIKDGPYSRELVMKRIVYSAILVFAIYLFPVDANGQSAGAPVIYEVKFVNGAFSDRGSVYLPTPCPPEGPTGVCGNGNSKGYYIIGKKGDRISITVRSKRRMAVFSVFYPNYEVFERGSAVTTWTGTLPADGYYRLNVFTNKGSTPFTITVVKHDRI